MAFVSIVLCYYLGCWFSTATVFLREVLESERFTWYRHLAWYIFNINHAMVHSHNCTGIVVAPECQSFILHVHMTAFSTGMSACGQRLSSSEGRLKRSTNAMASKPPVILQGLPLQPWRLCLASSG